MKTPKIYTSPKTEMMAMESFFDVEIILVESRGEFVKGGRPNLFCWFRTFRLSQTHEGRASVLAFDEAASEWKESTRMLSSDESLRVVDAVKMLGIPGRELDVRAAVDTSG